jgi:hypothetical protein
VAREPLAPSLRISHLLLTTEDTEVTEDVNQPTLWLMQFSSFLLPFLLRVLRALRGRKGSSTKGEGSMNAATASHQQRHTATALRPDGRLGTGSPTRDCRHPAQSCSFLSCLCPFQSPRRDKGMGSSKQLAGILIMSDPSETGASPACPPPRGSCRFATGGCAGTGPPPPTCAGGTVECPRSQARTRAPASRA